MHPCFLKYRQYRCTLVPHAVFQPWSWLNRRGIHRIFSWFELVSIKYSTSITCLICIYIYSNYIGFRVVHPIICASKEKWRLLMTIPQDWSPMSGAGWSSGDRLLTVFFSPPITWFFPEIDDIKHQIIATSNPIGNLGNLESYFF